ARCCVGRPRDNPPASTAAGLVPRRRSAGTETRALPDRNLRDLLHSRAAALVAAPATPRALATLHRRRELRLLRGLGLAVLLPPRVLDPVEPRPRDGDPRPLIPTREI